MITDYVTYLEGKSSDDDDGFPIMSLYPEPITLVSLQTQITCFVRDLELYSYLSVLKFFRTI